MSSAENFTQSAEQKGEYKIKICHIIILNFYLFTVCLFVKGALTRYRKFTLVSAHAWNWMKFCTMFAYGITLMIMRHWLLNVVPL